MDQCVAQGIGKYPGISRIGILPYRDNAKRRDNDGHYRFKIVPILQRRNGADIPSI
jgi:hypothetical protein